MLYIIKNLSQFAKKSTMIFVLFLICEITAIIVILFSHGAFQNYQTQFNIEAKKVDQKDFQITFGNIVESFENESGKIRYYNGDGSITVSQFRQVLDILDNETKSSFSGFYFNVKNTDNNCTSYLINEDDIIDVTENGGMEIDVPYISQRLEYDEKAKDYGLYNAYLENLSLSDGRYFTQNEILNGENKIMLPYDGNPDLIGQDIIFLGKAYKVIGILSDDMMWEFHVPFKTLDGNMTINRISTLNDKIITTDAYHKIKEAFYEVMGDKALIPPLETVNVNEIKFYNSLLFISVALAVVSAINLTILFRYVLKTRRRQLAIFQVAGCTKNKARQMYIVEIISLSILIFAGCTALYHFAILPQLSKYFEYITDVYNIKTYFTMFAIYMGSCYILLNAMIINNLRKSPVVLLKERCR